MSVVHRYSASLNSASHSGKEDRFTGGACDPPTLMPLVWNMVRSDTLLIEAFKTVKNTLYAIDSSFRGALSTTDISKSSRRCASSDGFVRKMHDASEESMKID